MEDGIKVSPQDIHGSQEGQSTNAPEPIQKVFDAFAGDKYEMKDIVNIPIVITNYSKEDSTKHPGTIYYKIQFIMMDMNGTPKVGFMTNGSKQLVEVLNANPPVPLYRTIIQKGRAFYFNENEANEQEVVAALVQSLNLDLSKLKRI